MIKGQVYHHVNNKTVELIEGELCFIRPGDVHAYHSSNNTDSEAINIVISANTVKDLFDYLGKGFDSTHLLNAELPPTVILSKPAKQRIKQQFQQLNTLPADQPEAIRSGLRMLLFQLIAEYFSPYKKASTSTLPAWLEKLCQQMQRLENFSLGTSQLRQLSGLSSEHLCRSFKKHLSTTPTAYINNLKLTYAANLLLRTDMTVTEIAFETGFDSLSYFHKRFKQSFGHTPSEHRTNHQNAFINKKIKIEH